MNAASADPAFDRSIVLVGLMGSGKSAIGRRLAARIGMDFIDADSEIEDAAGLSVNDIFEVHGEQAFRDGERRVIARLLSEPPHVWPRVVVPSLTQRRVSELRSAPSPYGCVRISMFCCAASRAATTGRS